MEMETQLREATKPSDHQKVKRLSTIHSSFHRFRPSPQEVMPTLTHVFLAFEQRLLEFSFIKSAVFGGSILCVAGLFGCEIVAVVDQMLAFKQNCRCECEDLFQIGITTGEHERIHNYLMIQHSGRLIGQDIMQLREY
jgi:hypothetical protein